MQAKIKVHHLQIQGKMTINIATYGICQEMHGNGPQSTLRTPTLAALALVLVMEGISSQMMAELSFTRLTVAATLRLAALAVVVYVHYFM